MGCDIIINQQPSLTTSDRSPPKKKDKGPQTCRGSPQGPRKLHEKTKGKALKR